MLALTVAMFPVLPMVAVFAFTAVRSSSTFASVIRPLARPRTVIPVVVVVPFDAVQGILERTDQYLAAVVMRNFRLPVKKWDSDKTSIFLVK